MEVKTYHSLCGSGLKYLYKNIQKVCQNRELIPLLFCHRLVFIQILPSQPYLSLICLSICHYTYLKAEHKPEELLAVLKLWPKGALVKCLLARSKAVKIKVIPNEQRHNFQH